MSLEDEFAGMRRALLVRMAALTYNDPIKKVWNVAGAWKRLRKEVEKAATEDGEAIAYIEELQKTPEWLYFRKLRTHHYKLSKGYTTRAGVVRPSYRDRDAKAARERYDLRIKQGLKGRPDRMTQEARDRTNQHRRELYALKKSVPLPEGDDLYLGPDDPSCLG